MQVTNPANPSALFKKPTSENMSAREDFKWTDEARKYNNGYKSVKAKESKYDKWLHEFLDELIRLGYHKHPSFAKAKEYFDDGTDSVVAAQKYFDKSVE